jgi:hypothetical protein
MNEKAGVGAHGDTLRKKAICCSLGAITTLRFYWRFSFASKKDGASTALVDFTIGHGDLCITSAKATGWDWKKASQYRLVHCAGTKSYLKTEAATQRCVEQFAWEKRVSFFVGMHHPIVFFVLIETERERL